MLYMSDLTLYGLHKTNVIDCVGPCEFGLDHVIFEREVEEWLHKTNVIDEVKHSNLSHVYGTTILNI